MKRQENPLKNQKGFTLIEIIAVLVILGILSAVAVPKYMDLQNQARIKAADAAIAEVKSRLSNGFGIYLMKNNGTIPTTIAQICGTTGINDATVLPKSGSGAIPGMSATTDDYNASIATTGVITVTKVQNTTLTPAKTGTWKIPT